MKIYTGSVPFSLLVGILRVLARENKRVRIRNRDGERKGWIKGVSDSGILTMSGAGSSSCNVRGIEGVEVL